MFSKICGIDLRPEKFAMGAVAQTSIARLNGIVIHDNVQIDSKCPGSRSGPEGRPGPIRLQGHDNPLQFRNIWIVEK